jgi:hypothetical protein
MAIFDSLDAELSSRRLAGDVAPKAGGWMNIAELRCG